ncbi:MAG: hypothetical protein M3179_10835 [Actinomycetota bacterium]|nr:hypothetical protein [Actinomycetota bacterium]
MSDPTEPGAPGAGGAPPPPQYGAPQYGAPPQYQQQPYQAPPRNPAQTLEMVATIVIIAGCVAAACGLIAGFLAFASDEYSTTLKFQEFFLDLALGVGLGAIAIAAGFFLRMQARRPGP